MDGAQHLAPLAAVAVLGIKIAAPVKPDPAQD
jgi:hypothetical protein